MANRPSSQISYRLKQNAETFLNQAKSLDRSGDTEKARGTYILALKKYGELVDCSTTSEINRDYAKAAMSAILKRINELQVGFFREPAYTMAGLLNMAPPTQASPPRRTSSDSTAQSMRFAQIEDEKRDREQREEHARALQQLEEQKREMARERAYLDARRQEEDRYRQMKETEQQKRQEELAEKEQVLADQKRRIDIREQEQDIRDQQFRQEMTGGRDLQEVSKKSSKKKLKEERMQTKLDRKSRELDDMYQGKMANAELQLLQVRKDQENVNMQRQALDRQAQQQDFLRQMDIQEDYRRQGLLKKEHEVLEAQKKEDEARREQMKREREEFEEQKRQQELEAEEKRRDLTRLEKKIQKKNRALKERERHVADQMKEMEALSAEREEIEKRARELDEQARRMKEQMKELERRSKEQEAQQKKLEEQQRREAEKKVRSVESALSDHVIKIKDYRKVKSLGRGSFGHVYSAKKVSTGEMVAVKILNTEFTSADDQVAFLREVESLARANHPAVLKFMGFSLRAGDDPCPAILTEYLPNGSLQDVLDRKKKFTPTQIMIALYGTAEAMRYLHDELSMVHRDLKPPNVMLNADDEPVVGDFGLSKLMTQSLMRQSAISGSPVYMAPELMDRKDYTNKVDVYSYAVMAYELITGILAYDDIASIQTLVTKVVHGTRPKFPKTIEPAYKELITQAWDPDPECRPSFAEICEWFIEGRYATANCDMKMFKAYVRKIKGGSQRG